MYENKRTWSSCRRQQLLLILFVILDFSKALRCRTEDGPSEADMKRVIRSCMRKAGENEYFGHRNNGGMESGSSMNGFQSNTNFHYGQNGYQYNGNNKNNNNNNNNNNNYNNRGHQHSFRMDYGYDFDEDDDSDSDNDYSDNMGGSYDRNSNGRNIFQHRNRERNSILNNHNNGDNGGGGGGGGSGVSNTGGRSGHSNSNSNSNNNNNNNNGNNGGNQRNSNSKAYNNRGNNNNNNNNNNDRNSGSNSNGNGGRDGSGSSSSNNNARNFNNQHGNNNNNNSSSFDTACVIHCFFDEMNMLNKDDYPDKHKVHYLLTKDMRDRELRNFYADTIQSCYRYLETQRKRDKCQFARDLIQCMAEYAKANCDDWSEFNIIFN